MIKAKENLNLKEVTFPQCALGGEFQKWTTLWYSEDLADTLDDLHICTCEKGHKHKVARGKGTKKDWISAEAAAYQSGMNRAIALAIKQAIQKQRDRGTLFENKVRAWWEIDENGKIKQCSGRHDRDDEGRRSGICRISQGVSGSEWK